MTPFEIGDIILVPFPFTDQSATKKRPAVVVSSKPYNQERPDLIIMAVTSQIKPTPIIGEVIIQGWQTAGLLKPSAIKPVITTIEKTLVIKTMGRLKKKDQKALQNSLKKILG
ncbi:MAG: type II toxin-antitoxin system PemK/MazF family toxin [Gammaproteobacteria bacterium]|nr:type II toxin-antitoxin system PemK/MazF family toxin [Gammaproteobacteria bacterium]